MGKNQHDKGKDSREIGLTTTKKTGLDLRLFPGRSFIRSVGRVGDRETCADHGRVAPRDDALSALCSLLLDFDSFVLYS